MRVKIISDIHTSFYKDKCKGFISSLDTNADVLIIAGDLKNGPKHLRKTLKPFCDMYEDVIYVLGNHEYYLYSQQNVLDIMGGLKISNLHWLEKSHVSLKGQTFIGGTLWFEERPLSNYFFKSFGDYKYIKNACDFVYNEFKITKKYFEDNIKEGDIVITHHLPSPMCCDNKFADSVNNMFFYSNLEGIIDKLKPKMWVHGHTHVAHDFNISDTRVVCNPYGYEYESTGYSNKIINV